MAAETGFLIDGTIYEVPQLGSLTMDEGVVVYELCGVSPDDFVIEEGETDEEWDERTNKLMRHPGFWQALMQIAYQRGNPDAKAAQVKLVVGKTNRKEALSTVVGKDEEEEAVPLASTSEHSEASSSGSLENESSDKPLSENGGSDGESGSAVSAGQVVSIGTGRSDTSSPESPEITSAASHQAT